MKAHLAYLKYVLMHKWFVFLGCLLMRVPIHLAIIHDWTKFTPREWFPYVHQFYNPDGSKRKVRDASGAYDPNAQSDAFKRAWLSHQRNKHHWQAWVSLGNSGSLTELPIPEVYLREMIADWIGAGLANGSDGNPQPWYNKNKDDMVLNPDSRHRLEELMEGLR